MADRSPTHSADAAAAFWAACEQTSHGLQSLLDTTGDMIEFLHSTGEMDDRIVTGFLAQADQINAGVDELRQKIGQPHAAQK